jgi:demethylmenaquinone methyltransferase/2-methoxy-6-polyprenyl-1,4-benzoquinol methylase
MPERTADEVEHSRAVRAMFAGIAGKYDLLNHLLSVNTDKRWRRKVRKRLEYILAKKDAMVLDVACGTGDLAIELQKGSAAKVIGTDFCRPMLEIAKGKEPGMPFVEGDALSLSYPDSAFDAVTIAFGLRNLANFEDGLRELLRVLKPGGRLVILEFSSPVVPGFRGLFRLYFTRVLPMIGGLVSGERGAYEYLPDSVSKFPGQKGLAAMMQAAGFDNVEYTNLTGGIAAIHTGLRR